MQGLNRQLCSWQACPSALKIRDTGPQPMDVDQIGSVTKSRRASKEKTAKARARNKGKGKLLRHGKEKVARERKARVMARKVVVCGRATSVASQDIWRATWVKVQQVAEVPENVSVPSSVPSSSTRQATKQAQMKRVQVVSIPEAMEFDLTQMTAGTGDSSKICCMVRDDQVEEQFFECYQFASVEL